MDITNTAFVICAADNVATALSPLKAGEVRLTGETPCASLRVTEAVPDGHKVALRDMAEGTDIIKYGVIIGRATRSIPAGSWVHLHCMRSLVDDRSSHLDAQTGAPHDIDYE